VYKLLYATTRLEPSASDATAPQNWFSGGVCLVHVAAAAKLNTEKTRDNMMRVSFILVFFIIYILLNL
jgi:hypothetical protein